MSENPTLALEQGTLSGGPRLRRCFAVEELCAQWEGGREGKESKQFFPILYYAIFYNLSDGTTMDGIFGFCRIDRKAGNEALC